MCASMTSKDAALWWWNHSMMQSSDDPLGQRRGMNDFIIGTHCLHSGHPTSPQQQRSSGVLVSHWMTRLCCLMRIAQTCMCHVWSNGRLTLTCGMWNSEHPDDRNLKSFPLCLFISLIQIFHSVRLLGCSMGCRQKPWSINIPHGQSAKSICAPSCSLRTSMVALVHPTLMVKSQSAL